MVPEESFKSMIRDDSNSDKEYVDLPLNVSRIKDGSSKANLS